MFGQLGRDVTPKVDYLKPERISYFDDKDVQQINCGEHHSLALTSNGQVYGWGRNDVGQLEVIGSGGFGTVLRVKHKFDGQVFAVKRIEINDFDEKEVQNLVNVRSEYVVRYYHSWCEPDFGYIQMELCSQSLRHILEVKAQIIHRDLKPENIVIAYNVENGRFIKLCDFGLATVHDKRIHNRTSQKHTADRGTLEYQAPEVALRRFGRFFISFPRLLATICVLISSGLITGTVIALTIRFIVIAITPGGSEPLLRTRSGPRLHH
ncbi:unnamed protein product [Oppiella nova]|uniref:Protein kinase domain-containing protein n=1 Tax=Oppiella nova TaxID=334625 RepID=A0A7R9M4P7_9ACAR|nr:unnamed protein product [Oppiella nova]CAG2170470.1 unnamed protein product [Oppiella nova]